MNITEKNDVLARADVYIAIANAAKAKANAELAQEEVVHERAKIEKTKAETNSANKKGWKDVLEGVAAVGGVMISIAAFIWVKKK